jgi:outer membrane lipoprotein LolB
MRTLKILTLFFSILWLSGCASLTTEQTTTTNTNKPLTWESRAQTLSSVQTWDMSALIAIRNNSKKNNLTANMQWQQTPASYSILLFGPLGTGSAKLTGTRHHVALETSDGKVFTAPTPEALLAQQTHWDLPVSNLYYWIRGLPVPNLPSQKRFDDSNHLVELQQQGWQIQFLRYAPSNQIDLPRKIFLVNPELNVKIVINEWKI